MKTLYTVTPITTYRKEPFNVDQVRECLLQSNPRGLKFRPYSETKFCILIDYMDNDSISYRYDTASDKKFKSVSWQKFYDGIKGYLIDIEFAE